MFCIVWHNRSNKVGPIHGLSRYASFEDASYQICIWKELYPNNTYIIVPV